MANLRARRGRLIVLSDNVEAEQTLDLKGYNPQRREQVARLREEARLKRLTSDRSENLVSEVIHESIDCAEKLHSKWSTIDMESKRLMKELSEAKLMLGKSMRLCSETNSSMESVRLETRQLSSMEVCYISIPTRNALLTTILFIFHNSGSNRHGFCGPRFDTYSA
jgi:hypothetical protein